MPHLSDHDLRQIDDAWLAAQPDAVLRDLLSRALDDLRSARDRLNVSARTSSRPPSSMPPWHSGGAAVAPALDAAPEPLAGVDAARDDDAQTSSDESIAEHAPAATAVVDPRFPTTATAAPSRPPGRPGRRPGARGHGRTQTLLPSHTQMHRPSHCGGCRQPLADTDPAQPWTGWDTLEMHTLTPTDGGPARELGLRIECTRQLLLQQCCQRCGHTTRAQPRRQADDPLWAGVELSEQRLLGPRLAASVVYLCSRMRLPRRKVSELLNDWFGLQLSPALIDQTVRQAARSVEPLEEALASDLAQAALAHADETPWKEHGQLLWLWVIACCHTAMYVIGPRSREMFDNVLDVGFAGWLMSDGYVVYRRRLKRLRCWAHLLRKLRGLAESTHRQSARAGTGMLAEFSALMQAVFEARELADPDTEPAPGARAAPAVLQKSRIERLRALCEQHRHAKHAPLRELANEFLNDWDVILQPLHDPRLPLTNNYAERQLRHWVIARRISFGTRTEAGSRALALLASVIDTCRLRGANAIELIASAIHAARMQIPAPPLPPIPPHLRAETAAYGAA